MTAGAVVITGCDGQLGRALRSRWPGAVAVDVGDLDIGDAAAVERFAWRGVGLLLNAAAYTNVDGAETPAGRAASWRVNAAGVANLARAALAHGFTLVHVGTDYVFDGSGAPYAEGAALAPLGVYGASKAAGDLAASLVPRHYLVRTGWVIGDGRNFVRTMLELARRGVNPRVVCDQVGRPTFTAELVRAIGHLVDGGAAPGTYNVTNGGEPVSWAGFAREIFAAAGLDATVAEITTEEYRAGARGVAPRPRDSRFDLAKIRGLGFEPRDWRRSLAEYLAAV